MHGFSSGMATGGRIKPGMVAALMRGLATGTFARYLSSSVVALCADAGCFLIALQLGMSPARAAALGFCLGIAVNWVVSSRVMFADCVAQAGAERRRQQLLFALSALVGLGLTTGIVGGAAALAINPRLAKLVAVGVSFVTTSGMRHLLVFTRARFG